MAATLWAKEQQSGEEESMQVLMFLKAPFNKLQEDLKGSQATEEGSSGLFPR